MSSSPAAEGVDAAALASLTARALDARRMEQEAKRAGQRAETVEKVRALLELVGERILSR